MSLRYLYKMLFTHFSKEMKSVTKIWDQIDEVKRQNKEKIRKAINKY